MTAHRETALHGERGWLAGLDCFLCPEMQGWASPDHAWLADAARTLVCLLCTWDAPVAMWNSGIGRRGLDVPRLGTCSLASNAWPFFRRRGYWLPAQTVVDVARRCIFITVTAELLVIHLCTYHQKEHYYFNSPPFISCRSGR